ncbi:unnamed protein product [marine sediment metagenome]|uniref:Uncharacterized protein n=1 Tax=marine sediment metagenome TaxID=412755 RepID=X1JK38_9ZZZZ
MSMVKGIRIEPNEVRDFYDIDEGATAYTRDLWTRDGVVGLDWHVFNDGAAPLTVTLDGGITVTIPAAADLGMDNVKFAIITVTAIQHRLIIAGVQKRSPL